jgi:hypothetical protein
MVDIINSPADVINLALSRIGVSDRVGSIYEGSKQAKAAIDIYSQTRDEMLRAVDYGFAEQNVSLTMLKQAPPGGYFPPNLWDGTLNPPPPWVYAYTYPDTCLKVRSIKAIPLFVMNFDPHPNVFTIENDNYYVPSRKVILCNVPNAMAVITGQVTDPRLWEVDFTEAFAAELGRRLAPVLANLDVAKFAAADAAQATATADAREG